MNDVLNSNFCCVFAIFKTGIQPKFQQLNLTFNLLLIQFYKKYQTFFLLTILDIKKYFETFYLLSEKNVGKFDRVLKEHHIHTYIHIHTCTYIKEC